MHCRSPGGHVEFVEYRAEMRINGQRAEEKLVGDLGIGQALRHQLQDFDLAFSQAC